MTLLDSGVKRVLITGGAGYIGALMTARLLNDGVQVRVLDSLLHGGDAILGFLHQSGYEFHHGDVRDEEKLKECLQEVDAVLHLAALVGFPVCKKVGREEVWAVNVEATRSAYRLAKAAGVKRFIFASSYSNYGIAEGKVTEESPLNPQSLYADSKVAGEAFLLQQTGDPCVTCVRLSTLFGAAPRTRFDLMVNQFALTAHLGRKLVIYQRDFNRAFVHIQDVVEALCRIFSSSPEVVGGQVFNVGGDELNSSKGQLVTLIRKHWPNLDVEERTLEFSGDMRSIHVSFEKIRTVLGFVPGWTLEDGIKELHEMLTHGLISDPESSRFRNHPELVS